MDTINKAAVVDWLNALNAVYKDKAAYLTELDSPIGDADHGINMQRGFAAVSTDLSGEDAGIAEKDISTILKDAAMTLIRTVGGSSGPLYGTLFLRMSHAAQQQDTLSLETVVEMFDAGLKGVVERGKAELNDKTMVDALSPAVDALRKASTSGKSLAEALADATGAAEAGMTATIPMEAHKGRASYLGERSIGHQDPGATSTYYLIKAASDVWGA